MQDPGLNNVLKWSIKNSEASANGEPAPSDPGRGLDQEALARLMGAPSDADKMKDNMTVILSPEADIDSKVTAFDNFEQLIENLDNANNMESLGLWTPLADQLDSSESEVQRMAAWCIGTAVQNNPRAQERCLVIGVIPKLVHLCLNGSTPALRKKTVFALSSEVRNYQPGMDEFLKALPAQHGGLSAVDATDMDEIDKIMNQLRESAAK